MRNTFRALIALLLSVLVLLSACSQPSKDGNINGENGIPGESENLSGEVNPAQDDQGLEGPEGAGAEAEEPEIAETEPQIDLQEVKPDESGKIMIVMFHNFIEEYKSGDKEYTTTFSEFEKLLYTLYEKRYRLINISDYLNNNISVPAGCIPMIFTFDDGTPGQFNLVKEDGKLVANRKSAVGIMEEFNKKHPDFGLKGTFYVNLGLNTFPGEGTLEERLQYLIDKGFEIGNHTLTHVNLSQVKTAEKIQAEIGGNQKKMYELIPGYKMISFSLPYGVPSADLVQYVHKGEFEGTSYENLMVLEVGANPTMSPISNKFSPLSTSRVRATGIVPVECDLQWWLERLSRSEQYVSDGNPDTVTVPEHRLDSIDKERLGNKKLIVY